MCQRARLRAVAAATPGARVKFTRAGSGFEGAACPSIPEIERPPGALHRAPSSHSRGEMRSVRSCGESIHARARFCLAFLLRKTVTNRIPPA